MSRSLLKISTWTPNSTAIHIIIETPQGSRNKFAYDPEEKLFRLRHVLPAGAVFPFDFGFIPSTRGQDGDPIDVLLLNDAALFPGCLLEARLIGVIEAEQSEPASAEAGARDKRGSKDHNGEAKRAFQRNDRLIAVAAAAHDHGDVHELAELNSNLLREIEHFFVSYNQLRGRQFNVLGRGNAAAAQLLLKQAQKRYGKAA